MRRYFALPCTLTLFMTAPAAPSDDGSRLVSVDHYVRVKSSAPAIAGQDAQLYVREVVLVGTAFARRPGRGSSGVVRARRRHAGGSHI